MFIRRIKNEEKNSKIKIIGIGKAGHSIVMKLYNKKIKYHTCAITGWDGGTCWESPDTYLLLCDNNGNTKMKHTKEEANMLYDNHIVEIDSMLNHNLGGNVYLILTLSIGGGMGYILPRIIDQYLINYNKERGIIPHIYIVCAINSFKIDISDERTKEMLDILNKYVEEDKIELVVVDANDIKESIKGKGVGLVEYFEQVDDTVCDKINEVIERIEKNI